uniref:Uncharacterized protein n=1 Tax=Arundo donax TaxID=35708 RepID=A0A0A9L2A0_ARUDO
MLFFFPKPTNTDGVRLYFSSC